MKAKARILSVLLVFGFCAVQPVQALDDQSPEAIFVDTLVARPACFVATTLGTATFVLALPFAAMSGSVGKTADTLVVKPGKATFTRPLGDYSSLR